MAFSEKQYQHCLANVVLLPLLPMEISASRFDQVYSLAVGGFGIIALAQVS